MLKFYRTFVFFVLLVVENNLFSDFKCFLKFLFNLLLILKYFSLNKLNQNIYFSFNEKSNIFKPTQKSEPPILVIITSLPIISSLYLNHHLLSLLPRLQLQ